MRDVHVVMGGCVGVHLMILRSRTRGRVRVRRGMVRTSIRMGWKVTGMVRVGMGTWLEVVRCIGRKVSLRVGYIGTMRWVVSMGHVPRALLMMWRMAHVTTRRVRAHRMVTHLMMHGTTRMLRSARWLTPGRMLITPHRVMWPRHILGMTRQVMLVSRDIVIAWLVVKVSLRWWILWQ